MLDPLLLTDTLPASRDEAIEAAVNGMDLGTRDVVIVIARSFAGNCRYYGLARRFPNMLWFYQLKATQVPLKLESVDSKIWKAFHHHISGMILGRTASIPSTFKSYLIYAIPLALMGGWFLGWAQERVSPMFFSLLVLIGFFAAVVPVIKLSREVTQNASLRYRKVLTKWGPAFEKQGYWLVPVENNGWFYVQFTKNASNFTGASFRER